MINPAQTLNRFTVVSIENTTAQRYTDHVLAENSEDAFTLVALARPGVDLVACFEGHQEEVTPFSLCDPSAEIWTETHGANMIAALLKNHGVEIHAANGYLIDQFLRDGTNRREDRYGGPRRFKDLADYVDQIKKHNVVMHQGQPCNLPFDDVDSPDIELFLRSVWWHYRLRRYGDQLTVEIRPFGRDVSFKELWERLSQVLANVNKPLFEQAMDEWFAKTRPNGAQVIHNHPQVHHHHMVGQQEPPY